MGTETPDSSLRPYNDFLVTGKFAHPTYYNSGVDLGEVESDEWRYSETLSDNPERGIPEFEEARRAAGVTNHLRGTVRAGLFAATIGDKPLAQKVERRLRRMPSNDRR